MGSSSGSSGSEDDGELYSPLDDMEEVDVVEGLGSRTTLQPLPPPPLLAVPNLKELNMEEEPVAAAAAFEAVTGNGEDKEKIERDYAVARQLDQQLNSRKKEEGCMPGEFEAGETAQHRSSSSVRSVASSLWNGSVESQLEKAKAKNAVLKKKLEEMDSYVYQYQRAYQQERSHHHRMYNQAKALEMEFNAAKKHIHMQDEELKAVRNELGAVKQQLSDAVNLSEVRGKELKGAQVFLTKADTLSVTDVIQKVNALNEEIFQMAAFLGEVLVYEVLEPDANRQEHRQAAIESTYENARSTLGEMLASTLAHESMNDPKEESNPLLVQIVMQIALTNWCGKFGRRWTSYQRVDNESANEAKEGQPKESGSKSGTSKHFDHDRFISELYDSIRDHEDQAVAGRWRSLTKAHLPSSTTGWDHSLMLAICSSMSVAGWATRSTEEVAHIEKRLSSIFKPLIDLRKATGEDVTSADLEISIVQPGHTFDPAYMEDAYADGRSSSKSKKSAPEAVISTSGLGLHRLVVKRAKVGGVQRQMEILSMPKVVLEKTIKEALEPPPPAKKKKKQQPTSGDPGAGSTGGISLGGMLGIQ
ncbi:hypothetical protein EST38_g187 [Candolleomyces aberdarensis]|uniref:Uncharacterized protein n=1 Tax=Candolleomyces aberdarensis TaxID=2316362 RepID=A0A4Q2DY66_9AGAR|nr:hypothetical protein EST38_g187 [Candolleomyces aberdarensis]